MARLTLKQLAAENEALRNELHALRLINEGVKSDLEIMHTRFDEVCAELEAQRLPQHPVQRPLDFSEKRRAAMAAAKEMAMRTRLTVKVGS